MKLNRTERHIFKSNDFDEITYLSKNLYNYVNYQFRQIFIKLGVIPSAFDVINSLTKEKQIDYISLPAQTNQQVIKLIEKNWKSFFRAIKDYKKNPKKYKSCPKIPGYKKKNGRNIVIFTNQQVRLKDNYIHFPKKANITPIKTKVDNIRQVRIIPQSSCYIVEIVYEKEVKNANLDENLYLSIDLGLNNLATCIDNSGNRPFIINGKILKSMNQYYNKKKAYLQSLLGKNKRNSKRINNLSHKRNCKINDQLHKISKFIVDYCENHKIKNIVIGNNKNWKQNIKIGKRNNQNFVQIPHSKLINMIAYKAEEIGVKVIIVEESYTSKCSALNLEKICKHKNYLGKRIKRGLFQSSNNLINADVNGAMNILRKVTGDLIVKSIISTGLVFRPLTINIFDG